LLPQPERPYGGIRRYGEKDLNRVRFIKSAQRIGFTLEEIRQLLRLDDGTQCGEARAIAQHKLTDVQGRIADLKRIETVLNGLVHACASTTGKTTRCPIISALNTEG
jgi:MerR family mercuric resistance operon transcriptional regulator